MCNVIYKRTHDEKRANIDALRGAACPLTHTLDLPRYLIGWCVRATRRSSVSITENVAGLAASSKVTQAYFKFHRGHVTSISF